MNSKRIIKKYCEPIYADKFDNLDEMDNFLQNLHREIHTMDRPISKKEIEFLWKRFISIFAEAKYIKIDAKIT